MGEQEKAKMTGRENLGWRVIVAVLLAASMNANAAVVVVPRRKTHASYVAGRILSMEPVEIDHATWGQPTRFFVRRPKPTNRGLLNAETMEINIVGLSCDVGQPQTVFDGSTPVWFLCVEGLP